MSDPALAFLISVIDVLQAELFAVTEKFQKIPGRITAGHHKNIAHAGANKGFDRIIDHRLVIDRKKMLVGNFSEREKPASEPSRKDHTFHRKSFP